MSDPDVAEQLYRRCPACDGRGVVRIPPDKLATHLRGSFPIGYMACGSCVRGFAPVAEDSAVRERLRRYVVASLAVERGIDDMDLHNETVDELRAARDAVLRAGDLAAADPRGGGAES